VSSITIPFIIRDIQESKPELIIALGSRALKSLVNFTCDDKLSTLRKQDFKFGNIPVQTIYGADYIERMGGFRSKEYLSWQSDIRNITARYVSNYEDKTVETKLFQIGDYKQFMGMFLGCKTPKSLDYEANSLNTLHGDFRLGGIGLSDGTKSAYLMIRSYEKPGGEIPEAIKKPLARFLETLDDGNLLAFNNNYEYLATLNVFGVKLDKLYDVMQMCRTLAITGGLKDISETRLGVIGWTRDIEDWMSNLELILNVFKPTNTAKGPKIKKEYTILLEHGILEAYNVIKEKKLVNTPKIISAFEYIIKTSVKEYGSEEKAYELLEGWIKYKHTNSDWEIRYTDIPSVRKVEGEEVAGMIGLYEITEKDIKEIYDIAIGC
jgi:hypothetical protein